MAGFYLGHHCQCDKDDGAGQRRKSDQVVKQEADREIDRHPRQIEEGDRPAAGEEGAHRIEVADRLGTVALVADFQR